MSERLATLFVALAVPGLIGTGERRAASAIDSNAAPTDTIVRTALDLPPASIRVGLGATETEPHVTLGLRRIPVGATGIGGPRTSLTVAPTFGPQPALVVEPLTDMVLRQRAANFGVVPGEVFLPAPPRPRFATPEPDGDRFVTQYADLALNVRSRMELGGDWTRFEPCDAVFGVGCNPTLFPQLSPDVQFGVRVDGSILDRIQVDVDFDQAREFDAANRINIFYEGGQDDVLRRLEVGDVTFRLPQSRFLTEGIPAGNFGFQAEGQLGPLDFQTVWAQQRGDLNSRVFQLSGLGDQRAFVQEDTLVLDDADYVRGQFFFLVDPTLIDRYPHIDALQLDPSSAPPSIAPGDQPIQLYRFEDDPVFQQQVEGFIQAEAVGVSGGVQVTESGWFRNLQPGLDYFVHPSGLWIGLRSPLSREEMLAVTYVTALGDTIGDYNPEQVHNLGGRPQLRLLKASGANHQPGRPTWDLEMHQIYRVSGSPDVEPGSVELTVSLGERSAGRTFKRRPSGEDITFLRLFGLDEEAPLDALDPSAVYSPGEEVFQDQPPVQGTFIVFPTLQPFAVPPAVPSLGLTDVETAQILADDANARIYEEEDPFERDNGGRFRLSLGYRLRSEGVISSFSLGAFGIRDGSERIYLGDRLLTPGLDYEIDYDVGQVRLLEPDLLFASAPDASVRATWEQRSLFQVTPTQVFGFRTHAALGQGGELDLLGLYQAERSVVRRPILGTEPGAALVGGVSGRYATGVGWLDRLLELVPGLDPGAQSFLALDGELAMSLPNPNTQGRGFVDDFDAASELPISLLASNWMHGSAPAFRDGADAALPAVVDATTAAPLVWQHTWIVESPAGDSVGVHEGLFPGIDIDNQIRIAGSDVREPGLLLSFGSAPGGPPAWRSTMTSLSTNGLDLTKTEFLEFYAAGDAALTLVVDLGVVSEDAFFVDANGNTTGPRPDGGQWGLGLLDQEADPRDGEIWNDARDRIGVWGEDCVAERGRIYRIGDPRAICTAGNGRPDTEDLDTDGIVDTSERHLRYVVRLDGTSPFLERTRAETGTAFQLYRVPIRGTAGVEVGGPVSEADLRAVRHLRLTVAGPSGSVRVARMRLVGSRWIKRAGGGVLAGIVGDTLSGTGRVEVSTISRVTEGDAYTSPPGVLEELVDPTTAFSGQGIEFNEKSLGIAFEDVPSGGRAEVYHRFPQRPRNFLEYREARLWVIARAGDFGLGRPQRFFFKVGSDSENFYLYRTALDAPKGSAGVTAADWLPEVVIDFNQWLDLRRRAEVELSFASRAPGDPPVTVWSTDSTYAVVLADRGRAPNLAAVRELSMGIWNETGLPTSGEIWVDELRLGDAVRDAGLASSLNVELDGGGVLNTRLNMTNRGALFRQLRAQPTYQNDQSLNLFSTLAVDRWLPASWGLDLPVTLEMSRLRQAPTLLANSDVQADRIPNLRDTESRQTRVGFSVRKRTDSANPWLGFLVDGFDARGFYTTSDGSTVTTRHDTETLDAGVGWAREPEDRGFDLVPGFAEGLVRRVLPGFLEDGVVESRLRLTPERVSLGTSYLRQDSKIFRFERIVREPDDRFAVPTLAPRESVQMVGDVRMRPLQPLIADVTFLSLRDLLPSEEAVADPEVQDLIRAERARLAGIDLGWETTRTLRTNLGFRPTLVTWLRNDLDWTTVYQSERNSNFLERTPAGADTTLALARNARSQRDWGATLALDPGRLATAWLGPPIEGEHPDVSQLRSILSAVRPLSAVYRDGITSRFNRDAIDPRLGYQLGLGDPESFRVIGADTAATLTDRASWRLASGVTIPGGAGIDVSFSWTDATTLDTRSDRRTLLQTWPDIRASLPTIRPPSFTGIQSLNLSAGIARTRRTVQFGGPTTQRRFDEDLQLPVDVSINWARTLATTYRGSFRTGRGRDPTGDTEREQATHRLSLSSQLLPPGALARRLERPIQLSLIVSYMRERDCRNTVAGEECVPFLDQISRTASVSLNSSAGGLEFGVQASYDDRKSFVGQKTGSTQFQLGLFGQLDFAAGVLPVG